jgi:hypothetical protein
MPRNRQRHRDMANHEYHGDASRTHQNSPSFRHQIVAFPHHPAAKTSAGRAVGA